MQASLTYPNTRRDNTVDTYHGTDVNDPYQWLEDADSKDTADWVVEQNNLTATVLNQCTTKDQIKKRLTDLNNYEKFSCPSRKGDNYVYYYNNGLQNQSVLMISKDLTESQTLLDPNLLEADGTASLGVSSFSEDGKLFAYGVSKSGSDWQTISIRDTETFQDLEVDDAPEQLEWVKFSSISWTKDNLGFFYSRYPKPALFENKDKDKQDAGCETEKINGQQLYYHKIGTPQSADRLIFEQPDHPERMVLGQVTHDGNHLLITVSENCNPKNQLYCLDLQTNKTYHMIDTFDAGYDYVCNHNTTFFFRTNLNADQYRIVSMQLDTTPGKTFNSITEVVPETTNMLDSVVFVNHHDMLISYIQDVKEVICKFSFNKDFTTVTEMDTNIALPCGGTVTGVSGRWDDSVIYYQFKSYLYPGTIFKYDLLTNEQTTHRTTTLPGFDPSLFQLDQVFYPSKDGTKIPMYIMHKKSLEMNSNNPTYMFAYGGFGISLMPQFSSTLIMFMTNFNGVIAIPNIRGGGEYGEKWHQAGAKLNKQNCFDDFHAAAEYLTSNKYTSPKNLTIRGGSNGGLLMAACLNQRPELYGCVVAAVGVLDMLKFHKFTIGYAWVSDYGSSDNKEDFDNLIRYSPLHNVPTADSVDPTTFPAVILTTADHDDRVVPLHTFKYVSALQHSLGSTVINPLIARIESKAGHGGGKPLTKQINEAADIFSFAAKYTGGVWVD